MAIFFSAATAAGAFGGLLARGIVELDGARGLSGWAWIFVIEGAVTLAVGKSKRCRVSTLKGVTIGLTYLVIQLFRRSS